MQNSQKGKADKAGSGVSKKQAYITFGVVSLALIMSSIDGTIVSVSLPSILTDLRTNLAYVGWTITGYQFSQCVIMPVTGKLSDEWGRKRVFLVAVAIFTVSSMAAGLASNIYWLIFFRILQGIGGGAFMPSATGIISDSFVEQRATAIGLFTSIFPIGAIIGPNLGGFIVDHFSWRWIFFVNIPIGLALFACSILILPKGHSVPSKRQIDVAGAGLFASAILVILYAMTNWADNPESAGPVTWILFAVGGAVLWLLVRQESRVQQPIIEVRLLRWRPFLAANIYNFVFGAVAFGMFPLIPYYATVAYNMTAEQNGLMLTPRSLAMIVASAVTSLFIVRFRYRLPMIIGLVIISAGFFLLAQGYHDVNVLGLSLHNLVLLSSIVMLGGIGIGISNPAANNAVLDLIPEKIAAVAGLRGMFRITGGVFGTAIAVLVISHFQDKGEGFQQISFIYAILLLVLIPIVFLIPDAAHKRRDQFEAVQK
jgi:EmrB/QacA subfamily drug resistance transporter